MPAKREPVYHLSEGGERQSIKQCASYGPFQPQGAIDLSTIASTSVKATGSRWFKVLTGLLATLAIAVAVFFAGPRNAFGPDSPLPRAQAPQNVAELDTWISAQEAKVNGIKPGNAKGIVWAGEAGQRTPWSVVYIHGFSASRLETAPLTEQVAKALGANVFYTRLSGHGLPGAVMGQVSVQDWLADADEALRIGQQLGEKVLIISCSTGATLSTWLGTHDRNAQVAGHVFVSPNFGPKDTRADLINGPWGHQIAFGILGEQRNWTPASDAEANAWTSSYPTQALFPMMALVKGVREGALERFSTPVLVFYSAADETVEPEQTKAAIARFSSKTKQLVQVDYSESKGQHVLAGAIKAPKAVAPMAKTIIEWAQTLPAPAL
jgi:esterase/lipase